MTITADTTVYAGSTGKGIAFTDEDYRYKMAALLLKKTAYNEETGCLEWTGATIFNRSNHGTTYGRVKCFGKATLAHRVAYAVFNGEIPTGLTIDHTCYNTLCVNPAHLDLVTNKENNRRRALRAAGADKTETLSIVSAVEVSPSLTPLLETATSNTMKQSA